MPLSNLTEAQKHTLRLMVDFEYCAKAILKVQTMDARIVPLEVNTPQRILGEIFDKVKETRLLRAVILKGRRMGVSTYISGRFYQKTSFFDNMYAMQITHEPQATDFLFRMVKRFHNLSPKQIRPEILANNAKLLEFNNKDGDGLNSGFRVATSGKDDIGSGQLIHYLHLSEMSKMEQGNLYSLLTAVTQCVPKDGSVDTEVIYESTGRGMGGVFYKKFWGARYRFWISKLDADGKPVIVEEINEQASKENVETSVFLPWFCFEKNRLSVPPGFVITSDECKLKETYGLDDQQIFWRRFTVENECRGDVDIFNQEHPACPMDAFLGTGDPIFDNVELDKLSKLAPLPITRYECEIGIGQWRHDPAGRLRVWEEPMVSKSYVIGCLPDGETVLTDNGYKAIEHVLDTDMLVDDSGKLTRIVNLQRRPYSGVIIDVRPNFASSSTKFTPEHPIQVLSDNKIKRHSTGAGKKRYYDLSVKWKKAGDLLESDILRFPILYTGVLSKKDIVNKFPGQCGIRIDRRHDPEVILDKDFWWFIGFWLAEGWLPQGGNSKLNDIVMHCNATTERHFVDKAREIALRLFNRRLCVSVKNKSNVIDMKIASESIYNFIASNFGQKASGKFIPEWVKLLPRELKLSLVNGYFDGDGCCIKDKDKIRVNFVSVSKRLIDDVQDILFSCGFMCSAKVLRGESVTQFRGRAYKTKTTYELNVSARDAVVLLTEWGLGSYADGVIFKRDRHRRYGWIDGGYIYIKIKSIAEINGFSGYVNNFETESHSYCARFVSTHNCDVAEGLKIGDFSVAMVIDHVTGDQVAEWHGKCFIPGTRILTSAGMKPIEDVAVGDLVWTHRNRFKMVKTTFSREHDGEVISLRSKGNYETITTTLDHPILSATVERSHYKDKVYSHKKQKVYRDEVKSVAWLNAADVNHVFVPAHREEERIDGVCYHIKTMTAQRISVDVERGYCACGCGGTTNPVQRGNAGLGVAKGSPQKYIRGHVAPLMKEWILPLDNDFAYVLGYYASEGAISCRKSGEPEKVSFCFGSHEVETIAKDCYRRLISMQLNPFIAVRGSSTLVTVSNRTFAELVIRLAGRGAHKKMFAPEVMAWPKELLADLLAGCWLGDGTVDYTGQTTRHSITTVSPQMARQIRDIGIMSGLRTSLDFVEIGDGKHRYNIKWTVSDRIKYTGLDTGAGSAFKVIHKKVSHYKGTVYNLEVEEDNSYSTGCYVAHNCDPFEFAAVLDALGRRYNDALLAPERNNHGYATVQTLCENRYPNLYVERIPEPPGPPRKRFGWQTDSKRRFIMLDNLIRECREKTDGVKSTELFREMMCFKRQDNGKMEADPGMHDDRVMAYAIAKQVRKDILPPASKKNRVTKILTNRNINKVRASLGWT